MPYYDPRRVPAHGTPESTVFLVNEAPGLLEAHYGIPAVGQQGGNIYRALRWAETPWATRFTSFRWPRKIRESYKSPEKMQQNFQLRDAFLIARAQYLTCSNAYDRWPRSSCDVCDWVDPSKEDVLSSSNLDRLRGEVPKDHRILLICGKYAWLACCGNELEKPAARERTPLSESELGLVNRRLQSRFVKGWYMGHTRRWSLNPECTSAVLKEVYVAACWNRSF